MSSDRPTSAQNQELLSKMSTNSSAYVRNGLSVAPEKASDLDVPRAGNDMTLASSWRSVPDPTKADIELCDIILKEKTIDMENREFISPDAIDALLTEDVIEKELKDKTGRVPLSLVVDYVLNEPAIKIFATLVCCDLVDKMVDFYQCRLSDHHLPFDSNKRTTRPEGNLLMTWRHKHRHEFTVNQWMFLAPVFTKDVFSYTLDRRCPLPITSTGSEQQGGLTGSVVEVRVHEAHQKVLEKVCSSETRLESQF